MISGFVGVAVIPVIIILAGTGGWSAVAIGQACGSVAAVFSGYGWAITGPSSVAKLRSRDRPAYFAESLFARAVICAVVIVIPMIVAASISPVHKEAAALVAASLTVYGLGGTWFFVGSGNPTALLICDTVPRVLSNLAGIVVLLLFDSITAYAMAQFAFALVSVVLTAWVICGDRTVALLRKHRLSDIPVRLREHFHGLAVAVLSAAYLSLPVVLVAALNPQALVGYSVAEKLLRAANTAQLPFTQTIQGWIPRACGDAMLRERIRRGLGFSAALALLGGGALAILGPFFGRVLGADRVPVGYDISPAIGIALAMTILSQCAGIACLLALGRGAVVTLTALAGSVTALALLLAWTVPFGARGAMYGVALGEVVVTLIQLGALAMILSRARARAAHRDNAVQREAPEGRATAFREEEVNLSQ